MKKTTLQRKIIFIFLVLFVIQSISLCYKTYSINRKQVISQYSREALNVAKAASNYVNGDSIDRYLAEGKDAEYEDTAQNLRDLKQSFNARFVYIFIPDLTKNDSTYLFDISIDGEDESLVYNLSDHSGEIDVYSLVKNVYETGKAASDTVTTQSEFGHLVSAYVPVFDSSGSTVAVVGVDIDIQLMLDVIKSNTIQLVVSTGGIMLLFCIVMLLFVSRKVLVPIKKLSKHMDEYVSNGELTETLVDIHTGDELENMAKSYNMMTTQLKEYISSLTYVTAEKERIGAELDVANHIQASMLPCIFPAFPERPELDIYATMTPAKEVGGDFYDFFLVDDDHLVIVMADVSGKGVPAALFMVIAKTLLKNCAQTGLSPKEILEKVNNQLCENNDAELFVTVWLGILEITTGKIIAANAGHEYPVLKRAGGDYELVKDKHGFVLAGMDGARYKEYEWKLEPGDRIYLYTDGVAEATDSHNELYGTDRMINALNRNKDASSKELLRLLKADIDAFVGEAPQFDDITMFALELCRPETAMKKCRFTPSLDCIDEVTGFVEQQMESDGVPMKIVMQMNIAVDEIFSNIARYSKATDVTVGLLIQNDIATLRFADNGLPYNPIQKIDPDVSLSAEARDIGGLGIFIVKKSMDDVEYEYKDGLNILTLKKNLVSK